MQHYGAASKAMMPKEDHTLVVERAASSIVDGFAPVCKASDEVVIVCA